MTNTSVLAALVIACAVTQNRSTAGAVTIQPDKHLTASLASGDPATPQGCLRDDYIIEASPEQTLHIDAHSEAVDLVLELRGQSGRRWINDDADRSTVDPSLTVPLDEPGPFLLWVRSFRPGELGSYELTVTGSTE